jgi:signal peptidase I
MADSLGKKILGTAFNIIVGRDKKRHAHGDPTREVFETVVFVVVLVLMLKQFVAEAFVIPTGSMASTLWGDQIRVTCPECGQDFTVTAAASHGDPRTVPTETFCQNCGLAFAPKDPRDWNSGDRVLVGKYEYHVRKPKRFDVPVFKYPAEPYHAIEKTAMNYIKRLIGLPGETIAIHDGDLYQTTKLKYADRPRPDRPQDLWMKQYTYENDPDAIALFNQGGFEIIRKSPDEILAVRRLVFDLDRQPKSLTGIPRMRWHPSPDGGTGWTVEDKGLSHTGPATGWVRYQHVEPGSWKIDPASGAASSVQQPAYVLDHLAYNVAKGHDSKPNTLASFWVPDLIVECEASFSSANDQLTLELSKGPERFQALFTGGKCQLFRVPTTALDRPTQMAEQSTGIGSGKHSLRFANVDCRLTVWVDGKPLEFGSAGDYAPTTAKLKSSAADLHEPARIGAVGSVTVSELKLWRDVYYTCNTPALDKNGWPECGVQTYYVQPGHYFCLGDNSSASADGRAWGSVPERLMLGRAVVIYWPLSRIRVIK